MMETAEPTGQSLPLSGLVVIDASTVISGPLTGELLAEYGAMVVKVEHPEIGDSVRDTEFTPGGAGTWWKVLAQNKHAVTCRLSVPGGATLFKKMVSRADVVIENFRPGVMERWGLDYATLSAENPGLVMLRISGFGQTGPYAQRRGYGTLAEAMSGFASLNGERDGPPILPGLPLGDAMTGLTGAASVMMALWARDTGNGHGAEIDLSLYGSIAYSFGMLAAEVGVTGKSPERRGNRSWNTPRNAWQCKDGRWIAYATPNRKMISHLVKLVDLECDPRSEHSEVSPEFSRAIDDRVGDLVGRMTQTEAVDVLSEAGVAVGPLYSFEEMVADDHVVTREDFVVVDDEDFGRVRLPTAPARFGGVGRGAQRFPGAARGTHNAEIYRDWLGLSEKDLEELRDAGAI